jgi:hypothetical protein
MRISFLILIMLLLSVESTSALAANCTNSVGIEAAAGQRASELGAQLPTSAATIRFNGTSSDGLSDNYEVSIQDRLYCVATVSVQTKHNSCEVVSAGSVGDYYSCN